MAMALMFIFCFMMEPMAMRGCFTSSRRRAGACRSATTEAARFRRRDRGQSMRYCFSTRIVFGGGAMTMMPAALPASWCRAPSFADVTRPPLMRATFLSPTGNFCCRALARF